MQTPKSKPKKTTFRKWRKRVLVTLLIIIAVPIALFTIGWFNRDTIIYVLQDWYDDNNTGTLTIGEVNASFISGFPNVGFTLKDVKQTNTDTISDTHSSITIDQVKITIGAGKLLRGDIKFKSIKIKDAIITAEVISKRTLAYHENFKRVQQDKEHKGIIMPKWLDNKNVNFILENVKYITKDSILNKAFDLEIHTIKGSYSGDAFTLNGNISMDLTVNTLGFNTEKGSYFNGARVTGRPDFKIDLINNTISVPDFIFKVDKQNFNLEANFDLSNNDTYEFKLHNENTDFEATKGLLPNSIIESLTIYKLDKPLETKLHLLGKFAFDNNPNIKVDFSTSHNELLLDNKTAFKNVTFDAHLTTDIHNSHSLSHALTSGSDLKITFNDIEAELDDIEIAIDNSYYQSTPEAINFVEANILLKGSNKALAKLIDTDNFDFEGGTFELEANVIGDISHPYQFINKSTGHFNLKDTRVILKKNGLQLPIQTIDLALERDQSTLERLIVNFPNGEHLVLKGKLENISSLLSKNPISPTVSNISIDSKRLNINDFISLSKKFMPKSNNDIDNRKTLHETLDAIYTQFHPSFKIQVDALTYNDVTINNLNSEIDLVNPKTVVLRHFNFNYFDAYTSLKGHIVVPEPESNLRDAIYIDAEAISEGSIIVFKELFNIELLRFDAGEFQFKGKVTGNVKEITEILNNAKGDFVLYNTKLYYPPTEMNINIDSLALFVDKSDMLLKTFQLEIGDLYPIELSGNIKKFPSFLIDNIQDKGSIALKINAAFIDADSTLLALNALKNEVELKNSKQETALHQLFKDINTFNPKIEFSIDSLKYQDLITKNINALVYFENDSILKLNHLDFNFKNSAANIYGEIKAHTSQLDSLNNNPFDLNFLANIKGKSQDLNDYLKTQNFIFKSGDFEFKGQYEAQAQDLKILNSTGFGDLKLSQTLVNYEAAALQILVDSMHIRIADNVATLKTLDIDLPGKSSIFFSGAINEFSDFIKNTQHDGTRYSNFSLYSPYLDTSDIKTFLKIASSDSTKLKKQDFDLQQFKTLLSTINNSFYPIANITIDSLKQSDIDITDFGLNLSFNSENSLTIKDTHLNFHGGTLDLALDLDLKNENIAPVTISLQATKIDLHELVTRLDYFDDDALRSADKIEGQLNLNLNTEGNLNNDGSVDMSSLNGTLDLELLDVMLHNYKPIMENSVLMKDERFKTLNFRPIIQTFEIKDGELLIPRTEIQSSAIQLFAEGRLKFDDYMNIWLSLPWKNLKSNDGSILPEKTTFDNAGAKFYIQLLQDKSAKKEKNKKLKVKFRLSNRKLSKLMDELD